MRAEFPPIDQSKPASAIERKRAALFRETPLETCERWVLGTAWALRPKRIAALVPLTRAYIDHLFQGSDSLPDAGALGDACELVGIAGDLSPHTLMDAYARGLFSPRSFRPGEMILAG